MATIPEPSPKLVIQNKSDFKLSKIDYTDQNNKCISENGKKSETMALCHFKCTLKPTKGPAPG